MVTLTQGDLIRAEAEALVNTVNTVGVMGKGVALQFKKAYPENFKAYQAACRAGQVVLGRVFVTHTGRFQPRLIINFPTKEHWRSNSRLEDIEAGLLDLIRTLREEQIESVALPPLGCGLGGLNWADVRPMIESAFVELPNVRVLLFEPGHARASVDRIVTTAPPPLTAWRAALIRIVDAYRVLGFDATHVEAQKLLYFLARSGEPVKTGFSKGHFGPYDDGMRHALQSMDGHYILGFGDGARLDPVRITEGALEQANRLIVESDDAQAAEERIAKVVQLIEGFETPYGLELLATVHWVAAEDGADSFDEVVQKVHAWSLRKRQVLKKPHLEAAWLRLREQNWIT